MSLDPEELKRRRAGAQAKRQAQQKKTVTRLIIAGVAVILCAALILTLTMLSKTPEKPQGSASTEQTQPPQTVIHLAAAGDLNITESVIASGGVNHDYTATFLDVAPLLADADITALNFEGNLYGPPYGTDRSAPQTMAEALANVGVDFVQLANSYSIYKGMEGLGETINGIRTAGMEPLGVYPNATEAAKGKGYTLCSVEGIKIAFVAFTKGMDGMALPPGNEGCVNLLYADYSTDYQTVDTEGISRVLDAVAKEKPDLTVALLHWGSEFNNTVSQSQKDICQLMQTKGVDAIIGTHSHYVQQMQFNADDGSFIAYSMGDFLGDAQRAGSEYSVILDLEITKDNKSGQVKLTNFTYTPIFTVAEEGKPLRVVRIREAMKAFEEGHLNRVSQETYDAMKYALERIDARIKG